MSIRKRSLDFFTRIGEPFAAKSKEEGDRRAIVTVVLLVLSLILYWWLYL